LNFKNNSIFFFTARCNDYFIFNEMNKNEKPKQLYKVIDEFIDDMVNELIEELIDKINKEYVTIL